MNHHATHDVNTLGAWLRRACLGRGLELRRAPRTHDAWWCAGAWRSLVLGLGMVWFWGGASWVEAASVAVPKAAAGAASAASSGAAGSKGASGTAAGANSGSHESNSPDLFDQAERHVSGPQERHIVMEVNKADILRLDGKVADIFIANPEIANVQVSSMNTAYVFGVKPGTTTLMTADANGKILHAISLHVTHQLSEFRDMLRIHFPSAHVSAKTVPGGLLLSGTVTSAKAAEDVMLLAQSFVGPDAKVINTMQVIAPSQVRFHVRIAEVKRSVRENFGISWDLHVKSKGGQDFFDMATNSGATRAAASPLALGADEFGALRWGRNGNRFNFNGLLDMLSRMSLARVYAEPTLTALSGSTASFLVGGEIPVPVPGGLNQMGIEYKNFGVILSMTPTVVGERINIHFQIELSSPDSTISAIIQGQEAKGFSSRRTQTTVELGSGQTFAVGGLLKEDISGGTSGLPGLQDLPILGSLFRSTQFQNEQTELVILVTPYLVEPVSSGLMRPDDDVIFASFLETIFEGKVARQGTAQGSSAPIGPSGLRLIGQAGFAF